MKRINPSSISEWRIATKIRPILSKHIADCINQTNGLLGKFLVSTLEGNEPIKQNSMVCIGESGDIWLQSPEKLLKKYNVIGFDSFGWLRCEPKPENEVYAILVTKEMVPNEPLCDQSGPNSFSIVGQWGETINEELNIQIGFVGDFICKSISDPTDVWIVKHKLFINSYAFKT